MNVARPKLISGLAATVLIASASFAVAASAQNGSHSACRTQARERHFAPRHCQLERISLCTSLAQMLPGRAAVQGTCAKFWPPATVPTGLTPKKHGKGATGTFGVLTRADGTRQLTYDSAPVYTFLEDKKAGDLNGEGLYASGGFWLPILARSKIVPLPPSEAGAPARPARLVCRACIHSRGWKSSMVLENRCHADLAHRSRILQTRRSSN